MHDNCTAKSQTVGLNPKWGPLHRCPECKAYWVEVNSRHWEYSTPRPHENGVDGPEGINNSLQPVFYGSGEFGLANAVMCGAKLEGLKIENF
jgi:hypothetical protein